MWFLFLPTVIRVSATLFSMTGGMGFVAAATATLLWQSRQGYKPGEGRLTQRANDRYYGVKCDASSDYDVNRNLGRLTTLLPGLFGSLSNKEFDLTISEVEFLRTLLSPTLLHLGNIEEVVVLVTKQQDQAMLELLAELTDLLKVGVVPLKRWLEEFPRTRRAS